MGNAQGNSEVKPSKVQKRKSFIKFGKKLRSTSSNENVIDKGEPSDVFVDKRKSADSQQSVEKLSGRVFGNFTVFLFLHLSLTSWIC
jgi:hypothetical protein